MACEHFLKYWMIDFMKNYHSIYSSKINHHFSSICVQCSKAIGMKTEIYCMIENTIIFELRIHLAILNTLNILYTEQV